MSKFFKLGEDIPLFGNSEKLSIIDLPAMNIQAHCHEGTNGTAHFKEKGNPDVKSIPMLTSYEFAMGDYYAEKLNLKTIKK